MKLVSFSRGSEATYGAVVGEAGKEGVVLLGGRNGLPERIESFFASPDHLARARSIAEKERPEQLLSALQLLPAVPDPRKVLCVGINYVKHAAEAGRTVGKYPVIFQRYADSLVAHGKPIVRPRASEQLDFEGELAVIIGEGGSNISEADAMRHVAGYAVFNDASIRDWQFHTHQYGMGKNFASTGALGPFVITADEIPDYRKLGIRTFLNDEQMQEGQLDELAFDVPACISYISKALPWKPGDVLATGTPSGIGFKRTPPIFMKAGDRIRIEIAGIGVLENPIADEA